MLRMKRVFLVSILLIIFQFTFQIYGQESNSLKNIPQKFLMPSVMGLEPQDGDDVIDNHPWVVFSDRSENEVYDSKSLSHVDGKLNFGERLGVLDIDYRLKIMEVTKLDGYSNVPSQSLGWIKWENLVLASKSIVDSIDEIDLKAMIILVLGENSNDLKIRKYLNPLKRKDTVYHTGIFRFFYVYKKNSVIINNKSEDFYLLGTTTKATNEDDFYCWISKKHISTWSHRVLWEKNWDATAVSERESFVGDYGVVLSGGGDNGLEAECIRDTDRKTDSIRQCITNLNILIDYESKNELYKTRAVGVEHRYPILELDKDVQSDVVKIGRISAVQSPAGEISGEKIDSLMQTISNLRKINIVFVIDATESMENYSPGVRDGVKLAMEKIVKRVESQVNAGSEEKSNNSFSFGAVLYRDADMEKQVEKAPGEANPDWEKISDWVKTKLKLENVTYPPGGKKDADAEEAVFYGLNYATRMYPFNSAQSNYVILIGDCGDHKDTINRKNVHINEAVLADRFRRKNINFMAFQVANHGTDAYLKFNEQMTSFMFSIIRDSTIIDVDYQALIELPANKYNLIGRLQPQALNKKIDPDKFALTIDDNIQLIESDVNEKIHAIRDILYTQGDENAQDNSRRIYMVMKALDFSYDKAVETIKDGFSQEYQEGYASLNSVKMNNDYFKQVVLFKKSELSEINSDLNDLYKCANYPDSRKREKLQTTMTAFCKRFFGDMTNKSCENKKIAEILERIVGAECKHDFCKYTIGDIMGKVPMPMINNFIKYVNGYQENLSEIENTLYNYPGRYVIEDESGKVNEYLFIPIDDLP